MYYKIFNMKKGALAILLFVALLGCKKETPQTIETTVIPPVVKPTYSIATINYPTDTVKELSPISVKISYIISDLGGTNLSENGICWSTNATPTIADNKKIDTTDNKINKTIVSLLNNLKPQTKYYARPYAINSVGTAYGKEVSFITDTLNNCFSNAQIFNSQIVTAKLLSDGKILLVTNASELNNKYIPSLIRLNADGSIDNTFNYNNSKTLGNAIIYNTNILVQSDGKYLIAYDESYGRTFVRINTDGSIDATYKAGYFDGSPAQIEDIKLQNDNKLLVGGNFQYFNGKYVDKLIRINTDGSLDSTFKTIGFNSPIRKITVNNDGKIFVAGLFSRNGTKIINGIIKLNIDGSVDNSFDFAFNGSYVVPFFYVEILPQNKLLVVNQIGSNSPQIQRLNSDGTIDNSFPTITNVKVDNSNIKMTLQSDNFIYINGSFNTINGTTANGLIRMSYDGLIDKSLNVGDGFSNNNQGTLFNSPMITNDKKIIVYGNFVKYNGKKIKYFTKINYDGSICQ